MMMAHTRGGSVNRVNFRETFLLTQFCRSEDVHLLVALSLHGSMDKSVSIFVITAG